MTDFQVFYLKQVHENYISDSKKHFIEKLNGNMTKEAIMWELTTHELCGFLVLRETIRYGRIPTNNEMEKIVSDYVDELYDEIHEDDEDNEDEEEESESDSE